MYFYPKILSPQHFLQGIIFEMRVLLIKPPSHMKSLWYNCKLITWFKKYFVEKMGR